MEIKHFSASSYESYDWCQWKYYLTYSLGEREKGGTAALLGTIAHHVLEILSRASIVRHDRDSKIWDINYLWNIAFNHHYNESSDIAAEMQDDKIRKVCRGIIELCQSEHSPIRDNTISAEASFDFPIQDKRFIIEGDRYLRLRGRIDRVDKINDETIEIVDYKSGGRTNWNSKDRHKIDALDLHDKIQPRMYHLASKVLYPWAKNVLVTFIYFTDGGAVTTPFCDSDINDTHYMLFDQFDTIRKNDDPKRIDNFKCKFCNFKKDGTCDNLWKEKDELGIHFLTNKYRILNNKL